MRRLADLMGKVRESKYQLLREGKRVRKKEKRKRENVMERGGQKIFPESKG